MPIIILINKFNNLITMKTSTLKSILVTLLIALVIYVTVTPMALYHVAHKEQVKQTTYELVEPGSELEQFILNNDSIEDIR